MKLEHPPPHGHLTLSGVGHLNAILVQEGRREGCRSLELIDALSWAFDFLDTMQRKVLG